MAVVRDSSAKTLSQPKHCCSRQPQRGRVLIHNGLEYERFAREVSAAASRIARIYRLSASDADDLHSDVWVKVLENRRTVHALKGAAKVRKYLVAVARNLLLDQRDKSWGKWRPSAVAHRAGALGVALDRLVTRDGLSVDAAEATLRCAGVLPPGVSLSSIAATLPPRRKRLFVDVRAIDAASSRPLVPCESTWGPDRHHGEQRLQRALVAAIAGLADSDRQLLEWRFVDGMTIAAIAPIARIAAKPLYRHFSRLLRHLRAQLEEAGVDGATVRLLLSETPGTFSCELVGPASRRRFPERQIA